MHVLVSLLLQEKLRQACRASVLFTYLGTLRTAFDVMLRSAYMQKNLGTKVLEGGMAAARGEARKNKKYAERCKAQTPPIQFVPLALGTTGAAGPETLKTLQTVTRQTIWYAGLSDTDALRLIRTHVSSTLMKYLALQINLQSSASQALIPSMFSPTSNLRWELCLPLQMLPVCF